MKTFHINGICYPEEHYMVNMDSRLDEIEKMVDEKKYFTINRARQYCKTTGIKKITVGERSIVEAVV